MNRIVITTLNETIGWFDCDTAERWEEITDWNGNHHLSRATGSQWEHETLYHTRSHRWIVEHTSQWQGQLDAWHEIPEADAHAWLLRNEYLRELPDAALAELEV